MTHHSQTNIEGSVEQPLPACFPGGNHLNYGSSLNSLIESNNFHQPSQNKIWH